MTLIILVGEETMIEPERTQRGPQESHNQAANVDRMIGWTGAQLIERARVSDRGASYCGTSGASCTNSDSGGGQDAAVLDHIRNKRIVIRELRRRIEKISEEDEELNRVGPSLVVEGQMRSSCSALQPKAASFFGRKHSGSCAHLSYNQARPSLADHQGSDGRSCSDKKRKPEGQQRDTEVEWKGAGVLRRVARSAGGGVSSGSCRLAWTKTSLSKEITTATVGQRIKNFLDSFSSKIGNKSCQEAIGYALSHLENENLNLEVRTKDPLSPAERSRTRAFRASVSCQSALFDRAESELLRASSSISEDLTSRQVAGEERAFGGARLPCTALSLSTGNMTSGGCLVNSNSLNEDQPKQQPKLGELEDRRSTYGSSVGVVTTDFNYGSSFSSGNNCSEGNNNCAVTFQCSRDCAAQGQMGESPNDCKSPSNSNSNNNFDTSKQDKRHKRSKHIGALKKRENWDKNIEFLLAVIGFAVDLGNVWRFPYICYKNGGGAFLIPYTVMFVLGGLPIFYLEMSLGQYFSSGCLTVWRRVCPMAKGIGYAMCVLNFFTGLYYNTIISWAVFFFAESFTSVLPWTSCDNHWNSPDCRTIEQRQSIKQINATYSLLDQADSNQTKPIHFSSPTKDYFEREVLQVHLSSGIDDLGYIRTPLAIYLAVVFICIYFAIWKGVKSTGKAVWITALLPYFVLIPLLIRGVFLEGAWLGIKYYLYPQWLKILDVDVWVEAAKQIYFSLGPGFGTLMALSSYNKFNHNCRRDALIAALVNYFASFISGLVIFAVLGYMATIENVSISDVATEGPGLVFQVYPEGLATMRFSSMWSILFFMMVITLGIDSTFGGLESVITGLCDEYPRLLRAHRGTFIGLLIVLIYLCSLPTTTYGGNYVIYVLESYGTSLSLLFIVLVETIIVCWLYGADRFCKNLEEMYGETPGAYWRICWKYISPTILLMIFFAACGQELDKYHTLTNGHYTYPGWAPTIGLLMTGSSVCCIPIYALYYLKTKTSGSFLERLKIACKPIENELRNEKDIYVGVPLDKHGDEIDPLQDTVI